MSRKCLLLLLMVSLIASAATAQVAGRKIDTTMKSGKTGYRVSCTNKKPDKNMVSISPQGFGKDVRDFSFEIKGTVAGAETDDLNQDGYIDLVIYVLSGDSSRKGNIVGLINEANESVSPIVFPDILDDVKLRTGYKGYDSLYLMEGTIMRRFPIYDSANTAPSHVPTRTRVVQYKAMKGEAGRYKFSPIRSYEVAKQ